MSTLSNINLDNFIVTVTVTVENGKVTTTTTTTTKPQSGPYASVPKPLPENPPAGWTQKS